VANLQVNQTQRSGRTYIRIAATPKSPETRALLAQFKKGVRAIEKKWRARVAANKKRQARAKRRR
jgi:hypothetical protein